MRYLFRQYNHLGDLLMCLPGCEYLARQGHEVWFECDDRYRTIFDAVSYVKWAPPGSVKAERVLECQIHRPKQGRGNLRDIVYEMHPEIAPAIGRRAMFDRIPEVDYGLPKGHVLLAPFSYSLEVPGVDWLLDAIEERMGPREDVFCLSEKSYSLPIRTVSAKSLAHLPALIRDAGEFFSVNSAPTVIAASVRNHYYHVYSGNADGRCNYESPNQTVIHPSGHAGRARPRIYAGPDDALVARHDVREVSLRRVEQWRDPRPTDEILRGLAFRPEGDAASDWWRSPRYYPFYSGISNLVRPKRILEVGVRFGYSLIAMARGSPELEAVVGIDKEEHPGSQEKAARNVFSCGLSHLVRFVTDDSRKALPSLFRESFDLIHLDGAHDRAGTCADIADAWPLLRPGGVMVVDDTTHLPEAYAGVEDAKAVLADGIATSFYVETFRGWWVAVRR